MEIKFYTIPSCPWCKILRTWLKRRRLPFQELDLTESDKYRDEILQKSQQLTTPLTEINGEIIIGFDEKKLKVAVEKAKIKDKEEPPKEEEDLENSNTA